MAIFLLFPVFPDLPSSWRPLRVVTPIVNNPNNTRYTVLPKGTNREKTMSDGARMPGTNWCGKGFRADAFSSLGSYSRADRWDDHRCSTNWQIFL